MSGIPDVTSGRSRVLLWGLVLLGAVLAPACKCSGGKPSSATTWEGTRPSSFRACSEKSSSACDFGEACDAIQFDRLCLGGPCKSEQTGDLRCHRVCEDKACGSGETCESRTVLVNDTGGRKLPLCMCSGWNCPERGPLGTPWPDEGGITAWRSEQALPAALQDAEAAAGAGHLFVSGGSRFIEGSKASREPNPKVFSAPLLADGKLGPWREAGALPLALKDHGMAVVGGRLFVLGGSEAGVGPSNAVRSAPIQEDGALGPWRDEAPLPAPRTEHSLVAHGQDLWVFGGSEKQTAPKVAAGVLRARVSEAPEARVTAWEAVETPTPLYVNQGVAVARDVAFVLDAQGNLFTMGLGDDTGLRKEAPIPWQGAMDFRGYTRVHLVALDEDTLLAVMPEGRTLTGHIQPDATVKDWRQATRWYGATLGFTLATASGHVYGMGGLRDDPAAPVSPGVGSTSRAGAASASR
jgi:hypothetical protein